MDLLCIIPKSIIEVFMVPVKEQFGYMVSRGKYVREMELKMKDLDAARKNVVGLVRRQKSDYLEIPSEVDGWLKEVGDIETKVNRNLTDDDGGCCIWMINCNVGREAFNITEEIKSLMENHKQIHWPSKQNRLGDVDSINASTRHHKFTSRENTFNEALKALQPNHGSHMIALCGMGGVGKTTMMKELKNKVIEERMFSFIVELVIGEKTDPIAIQEAVADYLSITLQEKTKETRAARLRKCFTNVVKEESIEAVIGEKTNKILVILDDVWESVDLDDIGLSRLPNQGVNFKVLLTSRNKNVCRSMGVNAASIIQVNVFTDTEAQEFFHQSVRDLDDVDLDPRLDETGVNIVRKCQGLPLAVKTIACYLRGKRKETWDDALHCLELGDTEDILPKIFDMSYKNLNDDTRSVFLLCGLYPEDFSIPTEELVRYGWGLNLFPNRRTIKQARNRLNTCIEQLRDANLLIGTDAAGLVKMHDLVRGFVLTVISQDEHSIVRHGNMGEWSATSEYCNRLSLTCKAMFEFPGEYMKYPNLKLLKLVHGDNLLRHAHDLYGGMESLQVIAYESTHYLGFSRSLQCSTTLRTLCLENCSLTFDYSFIGELSNLEVLSFAHSCIRELPSIIQILKKLKLLDLTGCDHLLIDISVLKGLDKLEELYARVRETNDRKAINFLGGSSNDLAEFLKKLYALEVELFNHNAQPSKMSFEKLERFNISLGCFSMNTGDNLLPSENKLMLVATIRELLGSGVNKLFGKTKVLHLEVSDMNDLEQVVHAKPSNTPERPLFFTLRFLSVSSCKELTCLFTYHIASALSMLEDLHISSCPKLETLIHFKNGESEKITFPTLKRLFLKDLMKLSSLCHTSNVIELPELIELQISKLPMITDIFPQKKLATSDAVQSLLKEEVEVPKLTKITVENCESLVNLFPINPISLLCSLKDLVVKDCGSIEVLFNLDLGCFSEIEGKSSLRRIYVSGLKKLKQVWMVNGVHNSNLPIHSFKALEDLTISHYGSFTNLFTLTTTKMMDNSKNEIVEVTEDNSKNEIVKVIEEIPNEAVFEIDTEGASSSRELGNNQHALLPNLKQLNVYYIKEVRHVWKCNNWNKFFILQQPPNSSSFHNLTVIYVYECRNLEYLFSPLMLKHLFNLKRLRVEECDGMKEVISNGDDGNNEMCSTSISTHTNSSSPLFLDDLTLLYDRNLRRVDGDGTLASVNYEQHGQVDVRLGSLCQYSRRIQINGCYRLSSLIPSHAVTRLENLEELRAYHCADATEVFESEGSNNVSSTSQGVPKTINTPQLKNLRKLGMRVCESLTYIFTFSTLESLEQLRELEIDFCDSIQVIVKEEDGADTSKVVVFPCLKSLKLIDLPNLEAFFKGMNEFEWRALEEVEITRCPKMTRLTHGCSASPYLKYIDTEFGKYSPPECGLNFEMTKQETQFSDIMGLAFAELRLTVPLHVQIYVAVQLQRSHWSIFDTETPFPDIMGLPFAYLREIVSFEPNALKIFESSYDLNEIQFPRAPWSVSDLTHIHIDGGYGYSDVMETLLYDLLDKKKNRFISLHELLQLKELQKIEGALEEVFLATSSSSNEPLPAVIELPNLTEIDLCYLPRLECIRKRNQPRVLKFPNLTRLSIIECKSLGHVLSCSMVGSLSQLQELKIQDCSAMKAIFEEEEECDEKAKNQIEFRSLKSIMLEHLSTLQGFCLGCHDFQWPSLRTLYINGCPSLNVFTKGKSTAPNLKVIDTNFGTFDAKKDPNIISSIQEGNQMGGQLIRVVN